MAVDIRGDVNDIRVSAIHSDPKLGTWWAIGTDNEWLEIRTTKTGKIRVFEVKKGRHPYFTLTPIQDTSKGSA